METVVQIDIQEIIKNIKTIDLSGWMEWDGNTARYENDHYEVESGNNTIVIAIDVSIYGKTTSCDRLTPEEFNISDTSKHIEILDVFDNDGDEISIEDHERMMLVKAIENRIEASY